MRRHRRRRMRGRRFAGLALGHLHACAGPRLHGGARGGSGEQDGGVMDRLVAGVAGGDQNGGGGLRVRRRRFQRAAGFPASGSRRGRRERGDRVHYILGFERGGLEARHRARLPAANSTPHEEREGERRFCV